MQAPRSGAAQTSIPVAEAATHAAAAGPLQHTLAFEGQPAQLVIVTIVGGPVGPALDAAGIGVDVCAECISVRLPEQQPYTVRSSPGFVMHFRRTCVVQDGDAVYTRRSRFPLL